MKRIFKKYVLLYERGTAGCVYLYVYELTAHVIQITLLPFANHARMKHKNILLTHHDFICTGTEQLIVQYGNNK